MAIETDRLIAAAPVSPQEEALSVCKQLSGVRGVSDGICPPVNSPTEG